MKKTLILVLLTCIMHVQAQQISTGVSFFMNSTKFSDLQSNPDFTQSIATRNSRPTIGLLLNLNERVFSQHHLAIYDQVDETSSFSYYRYRYAFAAVQNNVCYELDDKFYLGAGLPLNITTHASQSTNFGTIDLMEEGNVPKLLYGFTALVGYTIKLNTNSQAYVDFTRAQFLNSLDTDPDQQFKAISYVLSVKVAFNL